MKSRLRNLGLIAVGAVAGVLISLNFQAVADRATRTALPIEELRAFTEVFGAIKSNYVEPVEDKRLITEAINGMLTGLDPHSSYLDQEAFKELQVGTQGQFGGLGIEVGMEDGFVKVISPIEDTPAFKAGIKPNDLIIKLDETPVKGMSLNDAVKRMRGKPNTTITLTISRKGESAPIVVTLTRAVIRVQSVKSKVIEPGYGWVRVSQFQESTAEHLVRHLTQMFKENPESQGAGARPAQRPGRPVARRRRHLVGFPAGEDALSCRPTGAPKTRRRSSTPLPRITRAVAAATTC